MIALYTKVFLNLVWFSNSWIVNAQQYHPLHIKMHFWFKM